MHSTGIRELRNSLSRQLRQLKPGQSIAITDRGHVIAELRASSATRRPTWPSDQYARLIDAGTIRPAVEAGDPLEDWPTSRMVKLPHGTAAALIDAERGD